MIYLNMFNYASLSELINLINKIYIPFSLTQLLWR